MGYCRHVRNAVAGLAILATLVTGCGGPSQGTVQDKSYTRAHYDSYMSCAGYNRKGWCIAWVPVTYYVPDAWELYVSDPKEGKGWVGVSSNMYERARVGMHWSEKDGLS